MEPRAIKDLAQIAKVNRAPVIAEGLGLLVAHVARLQRAREHLVGNASPEAAAILDAVRGEEAAKALILLDLVRHGWRDPTVDARLYHAFSNHMARGIYIHVTARSPDYLASVRVWADKLRESHYLDGPNDVDWIFRNEIEADREEAIYVDYVRTEDGDRWISPVGRRAGSTWPADIATQLIQSMSRLGLLSVEGLEIIATAWHDVVIDDSLGWFDHAARTRSIVQRAIDDGLPSQEPSQDDVNYVVRQWTFPLGTLDFKPLPVKKNKLAERRAAYRSTYL